MFYDLLYAFFDRSGVLFMSWQLNVSLRGSFPGATSSQGRRCADDRRGPHCREDGASHLPGGGGTGQVRLNSHRFRGIIALFHIYIYIYVAMNIS